MSLKNSKGFGLMLLVLIIGVAGIIFMSMNSLFASQSRQMQQRINDAKAAYLAQAGAMQAAYNWVTSNAAEANRTYAAIAPTVVTGSSQFVTGVDADFAYYDHSAAGWTTGGAGNACVQNGAVGDAAGNRCRRMRAFTIKNMRPGGGAAITVTHCRISWTGAQTVTSIWLNGVQKYAGAGANGALLDITDTALAVGTPFTGNTTYIEWNLSPNGTNNAGVTVQWTFSDDSSTKDSTSYPVLFWSAAASRPTLGRPTQRTFQITSTGQVKEQATANAVSAVKTVRGVVAFWTGATNPEIIDWDEVSKNLAIT